MEWNFRFLFIVFLSRCFHGGETTAYDSRNETDENNTSTAAPTRLNSCVVLKQAPKNDFLTECSNCTCDLTRKSCDINCFCDPDCTIDDKKTFRTNLNVVSTINRRKCFLSDPFYKINANVTVTRTADKLYCVSLRDVNTSCYRNWVRLSNAKIFKIIEHDFTLPISSHFDLYFSRTTWKVGQPILASTSSGYYFLGFPYIDLGGPCSSTGPILYLIDTAITCEHFVNNKEFCEENKFLNHLTYFNNISIAENATTFHGVDHFQCDKEFSNCEIGDFRPPVYNAATQTCENVITRVRYTFRHLGIRGVVKSEVKLATENVKIIAKQFFQVEFKWSNDSSEAFLKKSGNPGYLNGRPVISAVLTNDTIENVAPLIFPSSERTNKCLPSRIVHFGENLVIGCDVLIPYTNFAAMCNMLRNETRRFHQLSFDRIGSYGDLNATNFNNWVPITSFVKRNKLVTSFSLCENVSLSFHLRFDYALTGSRALPQSKIVGASFETVSTDYLFSCLGLKSCATGSHRVSLRFSVTFINVTKH